MLNDIISEHNLVSLILIELVYVMFALNIISMYCKCQFNLSVHAFHNSKYAIWFSFHLRKKYDVFNKTLKLFKYLSMNALN